MMDEKWAEKITEYSMPDAEKAFEYTHTAAKNIKDMIWNESFEDQDSEIIFDYLYNQIKVISFKDYLKRYIYTKAELEENFEDVDDKTYQDIILGSFAETNTPKSFHETSRKLSASVKNWLKQESVSRDVVFLLGFGLNMSVEDVSSFLTKALREQDFNFNNPEEVIYWFSLKNHYSAAKAMRLMEQYESLEPDDSEDYFDSRTVAVRSKVLALPEEELILFLRRLKAVHRDYPFSNTARNEFLSELDQVKEIILKLYSEDPDMPDDLTIKDITDANIEQVIYNGVPLDQRGNLMKASASKLKDHFSSKRLSRQRISQICFGKAPVDRSDLITLKFFIIASREEDEMPVDRFRHFMEDMNETLLRCYMGEINITNPYEAFILMCLLTDWPMAAFSEVWEYSYQNNEEASC